jgi:hypothetical protein
LEVSLFRKVGYYASLAEFRALEVPCNKLIRRITYNLPSYPTNLLYATTKHGGIGFARLSSCIQRSKLAFLEKLLLQSPEYEGIAFGLLTREARARGDPVVEGSAIYFSTDHHTGWWLSSCIQWLRWLGILLVVNGYRTLGTTDESILQFSWGKNNYLSKEECEKLNSCGIYTVGDLRLDRDNHPLEDDILNEEVSLRIGQCWLIQYLERWEVWDILSFSGTLISYQRWFQSSDVIGIAPQKGDRVILQQSEEIPAYQFFLKVMILIKIQNMHDATNIS